MRSASKWVFLSLFLLILLSWWAGRGTLRGDVGVLEVEGVIEDTHDSLELLKTYETSSALKAIVVRINSPGGLVAPTQELYQALRNAAKKKPIIASMGGMAASGGYYIACGADYILANPGTITGSIGVIMPHMDLSELLKFLKLRPDVIKSGHFKDLNTPYRPMRADERALLNELVTTLHRQFKQAVQDGRKLSREQVDKIADGRILTGLQAKELGLLDELGGLNDAIRIAAQRAGVKGDPKVLYPPKPTFFERLSGKAGVKSLRAQLPWEDLRLLAKPLFLAY